ncbi:MAG: oligosaccharide flippase family protein [Clostridia bacterium]|nr:oligosaccharide flippase family protein [Clostridia bacterium]
MKYERVRNTRRNAAWGMLEKGLSLLLPFLTRTALINTLGLSYGGIGGLFASILQLLSLAEMGLSSAVIFSMYKPLAENDGDAVRALMNFYRKTYRFIGLGIFGAGLTATPFLGLLTKGDYPPGLNIGAVYAVYLANFCASYFIFPECRALLSAAHRHDVLSKSAMGARAACCALQLAALLLAQSYALYLIMLPLSTLADGLICAFCARRAYPEFRCRGDIPAEKKRDIREKIKGLIVHRVCGSTRNSFDSIFISAFLGLAQVGIYGNYYYVLYSVRGMLDAVTQGMSAGVGNSVAVESVEKNWRDLMNLTFLYQWACGFCTVCLLVLYQPFMRLWMGEDRMFGTDAVIAFSIYFYVWTIGDIKSQYADARGIWWKDRARALTESLCNVLLNWALVRVFGVVGVILATAISILLVGFPWSVHILFKDYFGLRRLPGYFGAQALYASVTVFSCCLTWYASALLPWEGLMGFMANILLCLTLPNLIYFLCYWKTPYFRGALPLIRSILKG